MSTDPHEQCRWFNAKGLNVAYLNVNRLMCKLDLIKLCIDQQSIDIFGIGETFLDFNIDDSTLQVHHYFLERGDRIGKVGGGLVCFIKNNLNYKRRYDLEDENIETVWIELVFRSSANILICMLYRPPNAPINWLEYFHSALDKAYNENKEMLALGDINIDFLNHIEHTEKA